MTQVLALTCTGEVASTTPPPQTCRVLLPPLHGNLHLATQGAQRCVDVQILKGATIPTENVVEHGSQVKVPPQDVSSTGFCA